MMNPELSSEKPAGDAWTVKRILEWTAGYFKDRQIESPRLEAELLLAHVRSCDRIELYTGYGDILNDNERARMKGLVQRRVKNEPVAYLTGTKEFFSLEFQVSRDVLIPRPETELLVEETLKVISGMGQPKILELGTGSGCIACSIMVNSPMATLTAIDLSPAALKVAEQNAKKHSVENRIQFLQGDLYAPLENDMQFDVIVSNPPYVCDHELEELDPDVRDYEPKMALVAGRDGLDVIRRIISEGSQFLTAEGALLLEMDPAQSKAIEGLCKESDGFSNCKIMEDLTRRDRMAVIQK